MPVPSHITVSLKPEQLKSAMSMRALQPGSTIKVKILALRGDCALIDFGRFRATADIKIPATLGDELLLKVQETGKLVKLRLLESEPNQRSATNSVPRRFGNLAAESYRGVQHNPSSLRAFDSPVMSALRKAIDVLLSDYSDRQGRPFKQLDAKEPLQVFTGALPLEEERQAAKLKIYYPQKKKTGAKNCFQISLWLSTDRLGELRTDFNLVDKDLAITFFVADQATKTKIHDKHLDLQELLHPFFNQTRVRVFVSEKKIKNFDHEEVQATRDGRVDVRI